MPDAQRLLALFRGGDVAARQLQLLRQQQAARRVIVNNQHTFIELQRKRQRRGVLDRCGDGCRKAQHEGTAFAGFALHAERCATQLRQLATDTQAEAGAFLQRFALHVRLENGLRQRRTHADTAVADFQHIETLSGIRRFPLIQRDADFTLVGEFDGIAQQIREQLLEHQRIKQHPGLMHIAVVLQRNAFFRRLGTKQGNNLLGQSGQRHWLRAHLQGARFDLSQIKDIAHQQQQGTGRVRRRLNIVLMLRGLAEAALLKIQQANQRIQRRANFVAHLCQKTAFGLVGIIRPLTRFQQRLLVVTPLVQVFLQDVVAPEDEQHNQRRHRGVLHNIIAIIAPRGQTRRTGIADPLRHLQIQRLRRKSKQPLIQNLHQRRIVFACGKGDIGRRDRRRHQNAKAIAQIDFQQIAGDLFRQHHRINLAGKELFYRAKGVIGVDKLHRGEAFGQRVDERERLINCHLFSGHVGQRSPRRGILPRDQYPRALHIGAGEQQMSIAGVRRIGYRQHALCILFQRCF